MKLRVRLIALFLLVCTLVTMLPVTALSVFAGTDETPKEDAMEKIEADGALAIYKQGETLSYDDDGYIGIPYEVTVYFDASKGSAKPGYMTNGATPVILYVVNADFEKVGTDPDASIIKSMVQRGYAVAVLDYMNNEKAAGEDLDYSAQALRGKLGEGAFFANKSVFPEGVYRDNLLVPAGYDVLLNEVFFELDKHGTDGTLEKIVNVWNNDFRLYMKDVVIKWVHADGTRKATQKDFNGGDPVWYSDAAGKTVDAENGTYIKVKHTLAEVITDCVKADGTPIDLNLYAHVVYPTNPKEAVPIMTMFSSAGYLMTGSNNVERPQMQHFLFNGYAGLLYDYAWIPMGRNDHYGYFDGSSGEGKSVTGDNQSYATYTFNATQSATAANRFVRYLALSEADTYNFKIDKLGVFGISKAAWMTQLGAPVLRENLIVKEDGLSDSEVAEAVNTKINGFYQQLWLPGHHGETRYDNGITEAYTKDGITIDGGELQPFAVYDGNEISSGAEAVYSSCGAVTDYIDKGYSPLFITLNLQDTYNTEYGKQNEMANLCRVHDVPSLWLEADIAHTFANGVDYNHGVDTYKAFMDFFDYYLKDAPASVLYTTPRSGYAGMSTTQPITVKFIGQVSASEIEKVLITDQLGNKANGTWTSSYGNTEWTFTPDVLDGLTRYTLTVPSDLVGENGKTVEGVFTATFHTAPEIVADGAVNVKVNDYTSADVTFTVPACTDGAGSYKLRVKASYGVNKLTLLDGSGNVISSVNVSGEGWYELEILDAIKTATVGTELTLKLKTEYTAGSGAVYKEDFTSGKGNTTTASYVQYAYEEIAGENAMKVVIKTNEGQYKGDHHYYSYRNVLQASKAINGGNVFTKDDLGRTFLITFKIYDTVERQMRIQGKSVTSKNDKMLDYDRLIYNFTSKAGEWTEITVPYTVYETEYGTIGNISQNVYLYATPTGDTEMPFYIDSLTVTEVFTDLVLDKVQLVAYSNLESTYKDRTEGENFVIGENGYDTWKEAVTAAKDGDVIKLNGSYVLGDTDFAVFTANGVTVDLNGYKLVCDTAKSPFTLYGTGNAEATFTVKNGTVLLSDAPMFAYVSGDDTDFSIALERVGVEMYNVAQTTEVISSSAVNGSGNVKVDFTFTDCLINIDRSKMAKCPALVFPRGGAGLSISYTFKGGELVLNNTLDLTYTQTAFKLEQNDNGDYTNLLVCANMLDFPAITVIKDGEFCEFVSTGNELFGYAVYTAQKAAVSTEYGIVPEQYADADAYPFAIFSDNSFIGAKKTWPEALETVIAFTETASGATVTLLMRSDCSNATTPARMYKINGTLVFDLGGNTLKSNSSTLFECGNDTSYTGAYTSYETKIVCKNGTIVNDYGKIAAFENKTSIDKHYEIIFDKVNITVTEKNDRSEAIVAYNDSANAGVVYIDFTFNDCVFDFTDAHKKFTMIKASAADVVCDIKVNGGKMISDTAGSYAFFATDALDSVVYGKGSDEKYVTLTLSEGESAGTEGFKATDGNYYLFGNGKTEGGKTVYEFTKNPDSTPYGMIPSGNDDRFVVFVDGKFETSGDDWNFITRKILDTFNKKVGDEYPNFGKTVYVVMRSDYSGSAGSTRSAAWNGNVVIDLMGNTFTRTGTMFESEADTTHGSGTTVHNGVVDGYVNIMNNLNGGAPYETHITLKNGSIVSKGTGSNKYGHLIAVGGNHKADKKMSYTFDNIDFGVADDPSITLAVVWGTTDGAKMDLDIILNNCDMTFPTDTATPSTVIVRNGTATADIDLYFNGGTISGDLTNVKLCNNSVVPSVFFGKYNGKYTTLTVPTGTSFPVIGGINEDGEKVSFSGTGAVNGSNTTYSLVNDALVTEYGVINASNASVSDYPFIVFINGKQAGAYNTFPKALTKAREEVNSKGADAVIYLRSDHTNTSNSEKMYKTNGTIMLDLNGFTLTNDKGTLFECGIDSYYDADGADYQNYGTTRIIAKNGTLMVGKGRIFTAENATNSDKSFEIVFDNVDFGVTADSDRSECMVGYNKSDNTGNVNFTMDFIDCDIDLSCHGTKLKDFIKMNTGEADIVAAIRFIGGKVTGSLDGVKLVTLHGSNNSTTKHERGANGEYLTYELTAGTPANGNIAVIPAGERTNQGYSAVSTKDGVTTYKLGKMCTYGIIEPEYNYEKGCPFVVFVNGKAVAGASNWGKLTYALKDDVFVNYPGATATVYVQYDVVSSSGNAQFAFMNGTVNIDLNGHVLTNNANTLFEFGTNGYADYYNTTVNVFGGTILMGKGRLVVFESKSAYDKNYSITFTDVTFGLIEDYVATSGIKQEMFYHWDASGKGKVTVNINCIDCIFDLRGATADKPVTVFNIDSPNLDVKIAVKGGTVTADTANAVSFYVDGSYSALTMMKDGNGSYTTSSTADETIIGGRYDTAEGALSYGAPVGGISTLVPCSHTYDSDCDGSCNLCGAERTSASHVPSEEWTVTADGHYKTCTVEGCGAKLSADAHSGGKADCKNKAVCQFCSTAYGELDTDAHVKSDEYTSDNGEHWYECENGCGEKLDHSTCSSDTLLSNGTSHYKECDVCKGKFGEENCEGGKADCMNKAECTVCGNKYGEKDTTVHVGSADGSWVQENGKHWQVCECGEKLNEADCEGGKADCMNKAECAVCGNEYGEKDTTVHVGSADGSWVQENGKHWQVCECGEKISEADCEGGKADCMNKAECTVCGNEYGEKDTTVHVGSSDGSWVQENGKHWQVCECGEKLGEADCEGGKADCMNKAECTVCGNEYGELDDENHGANESEWLTDGVSHWHACQNGCDFKFDAAECSGGEATCVNKAVCSVCGNEYGDIDVENHDLAENYSYDDENHWYDCKNHCGQQVGKAPHEGGEATCSERARCKCGSYHGDVDPENHAPAEEWSSDGEKHWRECENGCGEKLDESYCSGGEATCSERAVCETCAGEYGDTLRHIHGYKYVSENGKHFKLCISGCGERYGEESCYGGVATCTEKAVCSVCKNSYGETAPDNHIPSFKLSADGEYHWYECINCGKELNKSTHVGKATCTSKAKCLVCGTEFGQIDENGHLASDEWSCDESGHWNECAYGCGEKLNFAAHSGTEATCTEKAKCDVCGKEYGELADHVYSTSWTVFGNKHWHECSCGARSDEAEHSYGEWQVTKEATSTEGGEQISSCICGEKLVKSTPVINKPASKSGMSGATVAAIALGATVVVGVGAIAVGGAVLGKKKKKQ